MRIDNTRRHLVLNVRESVHHELASKGQEMSVKFTCISENRQHIGKALTKKIAKNGDWEYTYIIPDQVVRAFMTFIVQTSSEFEPTSLDENDFGEEVILLPGSDGEFEELFFNLASRPGDNSVHLFASQQAIKTSCLSAKNRCVAFSIYCYKVAEIGTADHLNLARQFFHDTVKNISEISDTSHPRTNSFHLKCSCVCSYFHLVCMFGKIDEFQSVFQLLPSVLLSKASSHYTAGYPLTKILSIIAYLSFMRNDFHSFRVMTVLIDYLFRKSVRDIQHRTYTLYGELKVTHASSEFAQRCLAKYASYGFSHPQTQEDATKLLLSAVRFGKVATARLQNILSGQIEDETSNNVVGAAIGSLVDELLLLSGLSKEAIDSFYHDKSSKPEALLMSQLISRL